jgi:large conductance mechanosensitive channel
MNKFIKEFQEFAFKGNMIDLAVGVVIGGAFGKIITALVSDIIMPLVSYAIAFAKIPPDYTKWHLGNFLVGDLLNNIIDFLIVALVVFIVIVKLIGGVMKRAAALKAAEPPPAPTTKACPKCLTQIPLLATKCCACTADLPATA